jgi:hypothetical protein
MMRLALAGAVLAVAAVASAPVRADPKINVAPPPPPPSDTRPAPAFDYKHEVRKAARDRKAVAALLRPGDVAQLADFTPFGRGITVTEMKNLTILQAGRADEPVYMPPSVRQFLTRELLATGQFIVLERERVLEVLRELAFAKTPAVDANAAPRPGRLMGVHYMIEGSYFAQGGLPPDDVALDRVKREIARRRLNVDPRQSCVMYLTVTKVETGEIKAVACGADLQPLVAVKTAVEDLVDQMGQVVEPIKVSQVDRQTGQALLDVGSEDRVQVGDAFALGTPAAPGQPPAAPAATAKVVEVQPLYSVVQIPDASRPAVQDGQEARRVAAADPKAPAGDAKAPAPDAPKPPAPPPPPPPQ